MEKLSTIEYSIILIEVGIAKQTKEDGIFSAILPIDEIPSDYIKIQSLASPVINNENNVADESVDDLKRRRQELIRDYH
ncbi:hypothetical protein PGB90_007252 [Kerria lacca]